MTVASLHCAACDTTGLRECECVAHEGPNVRHERRRKVGEARFGTSARWRGWASLWPELLAEEHYALRFLEAKRSMNGVAAHVFEQCVRSKLTAASAACPRRDSSH